MNSGFKRIYELIEKLLFEFSIWYSILWVKTRISKNQFALKQEIYELNIEREMSFYSLVN